MVISRLKQPGETLLIILGTSKMIKRLGERLFKFYCHPDFQEDIQGDLEEYYALNLEEKGERYANMKYFLDALLLFRFSLLRNNWFSRNLNSIAMVKNNLKVAYRSMMRHKLYSFLNLGGLTVSIAACILIAIFVKDELSYDKHFKDSNRIFRVQSYLKFGNNEFDLATTAVPMAAAIKESFPEVEESARVNGNRIMVISVGQKYFNQDGITYADNSFFDIFSLPLIHGNRDHLLDEPNTTVLTQKTAEKLFDKENPVGKTIELDNGSTLKVTGVIEDIPGNTHFDFNMFITMLDLPRARSTSWTSNPFATYIRLNREESEEVVSGKLDYLIENYLAVQMMNRNGGTKEESLAEAREFANYSLMSVEDIHLFGHKTWEFQANGSVQRVYMFGSIGFFILLIACINFMNMATARASVRAKEIGVRKVLGSRKKQLVGQFLTEATLSSFIAIGLGTVLTMVLLPYFNQFTDKSIVNPIFGAGGLWPYLLLSGFVVGFLAGIYPALVLSAYRPLKVLKGEVTQPSRTFRMRDVLVTIQFVTSIALIIGSITVYRQLSYMQNKELGFDKDQVLVIDNTDLLDGRAEILKTELLQSPLVENVSVTGYLPADDTFSDQPMVKGDATTGDESISVQYWYVDHDYANTIGLSMDQGRFFDRAFQTDSLAVVINETAVEKLGYEGNPIGQKIKPERAIRDDSAPVYTIVGVMKDFHFQSMQEEILPHVFFLGESDWRVNVKYKAGNTKEIIELAENSWNALANGIPFEFDFLDSMFARSFEKEKRMKGIFTIFAALAISVACLGLFGLASYVAEQRKKELGIRKVLGASVSQLLNLLFSGFTKLVLFAAIIAIPIAYYFMKDWLADFAYPISLSPIIFIVGSLGTLVIAWLTVGYQSLKAVKRNPVDNLRYE